MQRFFACNPPYLDWSVFGLLDVLMVAESGPLKSIRVIVDNLQIAKAYLAGTDSGVSSRSRK
jgi:hypothetical protein